MIQFISRTPSTCQSSISSLIAHNSRWSSIFIKILPFPRKSSPFQIASKERMIWYSECFRPERIRDIRKIRLVWKAKKLDERGRRDYVRLCIHRVELKSERQPIRGLDQLERGESVFSKRGRGDSLLFDPRARSALLPLAKLDFLSGFHDLKARGEIEGADFPCHRENTGMTHRSGKRDRRCSLPPSLFPSLFPPIDRSIPLREIVILHFCSCTRKFPLHQTHQTRGTRAPMGIGRRISSIRERSFSREKRNLFLFRPSGYFSTEIFIPRTGICRRDLDKLGTWTLFREGFLSFQTGLAPALFIVIVVRVGLKYSTGGGEVFVWAPIAIEFSKGHRRESTPSPSASLGGIKY